MLDEAFREEMGECIVSAGDLIWGALVVVLSRVTHAVCRLDVVDDVWTTLRQRHDMVEGCISHAHRGPTNSTTPIIAREHIAGDDYITELRIIDERSAAANVVTSTLGVGMTPLRQMLFPGIRVCLSPALILGISAFPIRLVISASFLCHLLSVPLTIVSLLRCYLPRFRHPASVNASFDRFFIRVVPILIVCLLGLGI